MIVFTSLFCWGASADFIDSFKDYRTYYLVEPILPPPQGTELMVLLTNGKVRREGVLRESLSDLDVAGTLQFETDVVYSENSNPPPPPQLILPDKSEKSNQARLEKLERLRNRLENVYPGREVQVGFFKHASRFRLIELIPVGYDSSGMSRQRLVFYSSVFFTRNDRGALEFTQRTNGVHYGYLTDFLERMNRNEASVLRFSLPPNLEGSAVLHLVDLGGRIINQPYENFLLQLSQAISQSIPMPGRHLFESDRAAVLRDLFARQGESRLPLGLKQYFSLPVKLSGASQPGEPIRDEIVKFLIPTKEALEGKLDIPLVSESLGLQLRLRGGIAGRRTANPQLLVLTIERQRTDLEGTHPPFEFKLNLVAKANTVVTNETTGEAAILGPVEVSLKDISAAVTGSIHTSSPAEDANPRIFYSVPKSLGPILSQVDIKMWWWQEEAGKVALAPVRVQSAMTELTPKSSVLRNI
ncbi:MAG: hypothetical protein IPK68_00590 [Bdellovibrionales bacterium]|nr:hypothetical protein [Bdellovibrionales bacterium]